MYTGNENWVRQDDRSRLPDVVTNNIIMLEGDDNKLNAVLQIIIRTSALIKTIPVSRMSFRDDNLVKRADDWRESGQQKRTSSKGAGLFIALSKAQRFPRRLRLNTLCDEFHSTCKSKWLLYLRATKKTGVNDDMTCLHVDERTRRQFRLPCMSCDHCTYWDYRSGVRRGLNDNTSHHFCKKLIHFSSESFVCAPWLEEAFHTRVLCSQT